MGEKRVWKSTRGWKVLRDGEMWSYGISDEDIEEHLAYCQEDHPDVEFEVEEMTQDDLDNVYKGE